VIGFSSPLWLSTPNKEVVSGDRNWFLCSILTRNSPNQTVFFWNEHEQVREANLDGITLAQNGFA
jgi:hypothetical protein